MILRGVLVLTVGIAAVAIRVAPVESSRLLAAPVDRVLLPPQFSTEAAAIMRTAARVNCMRFASAGPNVEGPAVGYYSGYELVEPELALHPTLAEYFTRILLNRLSYREDPPAMMCLFDPHHALQFVTSDGREVAVVICFQCNDLLVIGGGTQWGGRFDPSESALRAAFDRLLRTPS